MKKPTLLLSISDYERKFDAGATQSELAHLPRLFFLNGSRLKARGVTKRG